MTLPKNPYTILELKALWAEENVNVEKCLQIGILKASIKLNPTELIRCKKNEAGKETFSNCSVRRGLFKIENYRKIKWTENSNHGLLCDFSARKVRISRKNYIFAFWGLNRDDVTTGYSNRVIRYSDILITAEEVERFKETYFQQGEETRNLISEAAKMLRKPQTADIDVQIEIVIEKIDKAIRDHLRSKKAGAVVNHILFLKDYDLDVKKRAKDKVKEYIEKRYSEFGYSVISHRPPRNAGYFISI